MRVLWVLILKRLRPLRCKSSGKHLSFRRYINHGPGCQRPVYANQCRRPHVRIITWSICQPSLIKVNIALCKYLRTKVMRLCIQTVLKRGYLCLVHSFSSIDLHLISPTSLGILNNTKTTLGRSLLRTWLLRPSLSLDTIRSRHDAVECFIRSENVSTATLMQTHLKGMKNTPRMLSTLCAGKGKLRDWQGIVKVGTIPF